MRHIYAYRVTYFIAALIVLVAMLFAWLRSQDVPPAQQEGAGHRRPEVVRSAGYPPGHVSFGAGRVAGRHERGGETLDATRDARLL